jgi:hypothetical protein
MGEIFHLNQGNEVTAQRIEGESDGIGDIFVHCYNNSSHSEPLEHCFQTYHMEALVEEMLVS